MHKRAIGFLSALCIAGTAFMCSAVSSTPAIANPNFKGKAVKFIVPFSPGGGTDTFARITTKHMRQFIPGKPKTVIRNAPGGGSVIGANMGYKAKPNGLTLLVTSGSTVMENILRSKGVEYYLETMHPIYSAPSGLIYWTSPEVIKEPLDIFDTDQLIFGHISPTGGTGSLFVWAKELLGFTSKDIWGYEGGSAARGAFHQGEVNIGGESTIGFNSSMLSYLDKKEIVPMFQSGILDENGNVIREPAAPDVPTVAELYEMKYGKKPSGQAYEAYKLIVGTRTYGKAMLLPTETPAEVVAAYDQAVTEMIVDKGFLADAEKMNPGAPHFSGASLKKSYPQSVAAPPELLEFMKKVYREKYNATLE